MNEVGADGDIFLHFAAPARRSGSNAAAGAAFGARPAQAG